MHAEATPEPPATVIVRRTWSWSRLGTVQEWGVVLRGHDGKRHVVTADSPEEVGAAVAPGCLSARPPSPSSRS